MRIHPKTITLLFAAVLFVPVSFARGEEASPVTLELADLEKEVLARNPEISAMKGMAEAEEKGARAALWPRDPMITYERGGQARPFNLGDATMERVGVEQSFAFPGRGLADARAVRHAARAARFRSDDVKWDVLAMARIAYWDFWENTKVAEIRARAEEEWRRINSVVQTRGLSGQFVSPTLLRMQVEIAESANQLLLARRNIRAVGARLDRLLGSGPGTEYVLGVVPPLPRWEGLDASWIKAIRDNPRVKVAHHEVERRKALRDSARLAMLPEFTVGVSGTRIPGESSFRETAVMVRASLPLFLPFKQSRASAAASDEWKVSLMSLQDEEADVVREVEEAAARAEAAGRLWELYEKGGLEAQAERAWRVAQDSWRAEALALPEYAESFSLYLTARIKAIRARADYGRALAELSCALCIKDPLSEVKP